MHRDEFERWRQEGHDHVESLLDKFLQPHGIKASDANVHMLQGYPAQVISSFAEEYHVDLIVMGTVARSGLWGMAIGNTAERILDAVNCSVLAVKPANFVTPIKAGEYIGASRERSNEVTREAK